MRGSRAGVVGGHSDECLLEEGTVLKYLLLAGVRRIESCACVVEVVGNAPATECVRV